MKALQLATFCKVDLVPTFKKFAKKHKIIQVYQEIKKELEKFNYNRSIMFANIKIKRDLMYLKGLQELYTSYIQWINTLNSLGHLDFNSSRELSIFFEWNYPYCESKPIGNHDSMIELCGCCYNLACISFNTGLLYIEADVLKGFVLAKMEFAKANSLFLYIFDHYYNKVIVSKPIPISVTTMNFLLSLTRVITKACRIIEIAEKPFNIIEDDRLAQKIIDLHNSVEELLKSAKRDKKFGSKYIAMIYPKNKKHKSKVENSCLLVRYLFFKSKLWDKVLKLINGIQPQIANIQKNTYYQYDEQSTEIGIKDYAIELMTNFTEEFKIKRFVTFEASEFRNNLFKATNSRVKKIDNLLHKYGKIRKLFKQTNDNYAHGFRNTREKKAQIKIILTSVFLKYSSIESYSLKFTENIKSLIKLKQDFSTKYSEIQANMALCKMEDNGFEFDPFYEYENEDKLMPISIVINNLLHKQKRVIKELPNLDSTLSLDNLKSLLNKLKMVRPEDRNPNIKVKLNKAEKSAFDTCYEEISDLGTFKNDILQTRDKLVEFKNKENIKEYEKEFLEYWRSKKDVSYQRFILKFLPAELEKEFQRDLSTFQENYTKLKKIIQGTNYDILTELEEASELLSLMVEVIETNGALTDILEELDAEPTIRTSLKNLSRKLPSSLFTSEIGSQSSFHEKGSLFKSFSSVNRPELDRNISNQRFIYIVDKIHRDYLLMKVNKLWKPKEQVLDEQCCIEEDNSEERKSVNISGFSLLNK
ncbi:unnamed protein product [Moneuplotes crassus]|uniref:BRO1 domain-containing protein n=1 Tax=Euplotes crassus TaxID=5936 RepID=A0AAD2DB85_EUPCR|nr:unnamed protein product [Moneuplotes crassus]